LASEGPQYGLPVADRMARTGLLDVPAGPLETSLPSCALGPIRPWGLSLRGSVFQWERFSEEERWFWSSPWDLHLCESLGVSGRHLSPCSALPRVLLLASIRKPAEWPEVSIIRLELMTVASVHRHDALSPKDAKGKGDVHWHCTMSKAKRSKHVVLPADRMFKRGITRDRSTGPRLFWHSLPARLWTNFASSGLSALALTVVCRSGVGIAGRSEMPPV